MEREKILYELSGKVTCEEWKPIQGYEGIYEISNYGRIKSIARSGNNRTLKDRIMKQHKGKTGYKQVRLCKDNHTKLWKVHVLIARAFIENHCNLPIVNHKDGNKENNEISNLEWCTYSHNIKHAYDFGLRKMSKITQRKTDGTMVKVWRCMSEASRETGINLSHICDCCNKKRAQAGGFLWRYME